MDSVDNPAQEEEFKTVASLCRLTGLSRQRIWILIKDGRIPAPTQIAPKRWIYSDADYAAAVDGLRIKLQPWAVKKEKNRAAIADHPAPADPPILDEQSGANFDRFVAGDR